MKVKALNLYDSFGGMDHYNQILCAGYNTKPMSLFSGNYWFLLAQIFLGFKNKHLKKFISNLEDYNIIHITDGSLFTYPVIKYLLKNSNLKIIYTLHDPLPHVEESKIKKFVNFLSMISNKAVSRISNQFPKRVYIHIHSKALLADYLLKNKNLIIQPHPIGIVNENVGDLFNINDKIVISFVGRVEYYKGIDIFLNTIIKLDGFKKLNKEISIIIGGKSNTNLVIPQTHNIKIEHYNRYLTDDELDSIIKYSKIIVLPYRNATASGILTRVIAMNTPAIVSNQGCLPDYIQNGVNGFIYNNETELEKTIIQSLDHKFSKASLDFRPTSICKLIINHIK